MKTLGFGIKSLLKDPKWAAKHVGNYQQNNPVKPQENENDIYAQNKTQVVSGGKDESVFNRAKKGDVNTENNIYAQNQTRVNPLTKDADIFSLSKAGNAEGGKNNIFAMMNKFDEDHKILMGAQGVQPASQMDPMASFGGEDEIQKKLGKKLNILM